MVAALAAQTGIAAPGSKQPLVLAYFIPAGCQPIPGYVERLDRIMTEVQRFYREGMQAAGHGPMTFDLERDGAGKLVVHTIEARHPQQIYGRNSSSAVREEVNSALVGKGLNVDARTLVIFQVLLQWQEGKAVEVGPYVGGGSHFSGTAWVYDDALLDPEKLSSTEPGGYYMRPVSVGQFNTHYIGGVAHELGHALGLPHVAAAKPERRHSLMGDGNHTYGQELRGQGPGTYLHPASAMLLARCKPFAGDLPGARQRSNAELVELQARFRDGELLLEGKVESSPAAFGLVAYNDRTSIASDYDATGWVSSVDADGRFSLAIGDLQAGDYELRLQVCHTNGATSTSAFHYRVDPDRVPDLAPFSGSFVVLNRAVKAYVARSRQEAATLLEQLDQAPSAPPTARRKAAHLRRLLQPGKAESLGQVPPNQPRVHVSQVEFANASVGWGSPLRDQVLAEAGGTCFLQVGGEFFERGLFAHAPSKYVLETAGAWKSLTSGFGLQDGHGGSVHFVVRGDDRELFRSPRVTGHKIQRLDLDIASIKRLELIVEDAGDGPGSDWGVWLEPVLSR